MSNKKQQSTSSGSTIRQLRQLPGTMTCIFEHVTSSSTAEFRWDGPTLNEIWPEVLAFFRWTNDTMRSESQVRLFVNVRTKEWKAWAFPQKANLGMSAKELTEGDEGYEKTKEQRAMFPDPDWYYWGTVHHHCNASAFQSSTDTENERGQDGIHITVGCLSSNHYDIHARLYVDKFKLTLHLADFWDVGDWTANMPPYVKRMLPPEADDEAAKQQMGIPPATDQSYPEIWKTNVIDCTPKQMVASSPTHVSFQPSHPTGFQTSFRSYVARGKPNFETDLRRAAAQMASMMSHPQCSLNGINDLLNCLRHIEAMLDDEMLDLMDIMSRCDVLPANMINYLMDLQKRGLEAGDQKTKPNEHGKATQQQVLGMQTNHGVYNNDSHGWEGMGG